MAFKTILTHVAPDSRCQARLRMTASVARAVGARVVGVGAQPPWPYANAGAGEGRAFEALVKTAQQDIDDARALFQGAMGPTGLVTEWRGEIGYPDIVIPRHARIADMIVAYRTGPSTDQISYAAPDTMVMEAGLPVLLLPAREVEFRAETILVAWKNTREARRAITTTLPLLTGARRVLVAAVCAAREVAQVEAELADVAERLSRHGAKVSTLAEVGAPGAAASRLLRIAGTDKSDLVVAGGYGHSRLREWILGGVTQDLIADAGRYVLLSH